MRMALRRYRVTYLNHAMSVSRGKLESESYPSASDTDTVSGVPRDPCWAKSATTCHGGIMTAGTDLNLFIFDARDHLLLSVLVNKISRIFYTHKPT